MERTTNELLQEFFIHLMRYIISRYEHNTDWIADYTDDYVIYDRSSVPVKDAIIVPNVGSDIYDKLTFIIDNYDALPEVAVYTKCNLFKYITKEEFDLIKDNTTFTPIMSKQHPETEIDFDGVNERMIPDINAKVPDPKLRELFYKLNMIGKTGVGKFSFYDEMGMYNELNIPAYLNAHACKNFEAMEELMKLVGTWDKEYVQFAPGSNYILPRENILKHSKEFYEKLRSYIDWEVYPGEVFILERGLYNLWK